MDIDHFLFDKLWQTSNTITGFAVAQVLVYLYATEKEPVRSQIRSRWFMVSIMIVGFHAAYVYAVYWCHEKMLLLTLTEYECTKVDYSHIFSRIEIGQQMIIISLGLLAVCITYINRDAKNVRL